MTIALMLNRAKVNVASGSAMIRVAVRLRTISGSMTRSDALLILGRENGGCDACRSIISQAPEQSRYGNSAA